MSPTHHLVAWLSDPANHPDNPQHVQVFETHISWVFVARHFAYKLKKPVRLPFLNFEPLRARQVACQDEVRLNRRLAPDVYLGTVAVTRAPGGGLELDGSGETVDWLVKMRRLDAPRRCDERLERGDIQDEQWAELIEVLANFYRHAPAKPIKPSHYVTRLLAHVISNRRDLLRNIDESAHSIVKSIHAEQLVLLKIFADCFYDRVCEGRVIDGHGDLRPEHVYFYSPPKIVDCIEFDPEYRLVDICDDLSFFAMECAAMGKPDAGQRVMRDCLTAIGDAPRDALVRFYMGYRACVRAKVALCRPDRTTIDQPGRTEQALHYLHIAASHAPLGGPPWLIVVCGGVGTGKSTLARNLALDLGFELLQTDAVRRDLFGAAGHGAGMDEGIYSRANRLKVYHEAFQRAARSLDESVPVVVDGSFQLAGAWEELEHLLPHLSARVLVVHCRCSPELARRRIEKRLAGNRSESDARPEMVRSDGAAHVEIPANLARVGVDTANPPSILADCIYRRMRTMIGG